MCPADLEQKLCVIAGFPRTATTFLHLTLATHPDAFVTPRKELDFFSFNYEKGRKWYEKFYQSVGNERRCFDVSPTYSLHQEAAERIAAFSPSAPVVLILRNPVEWAVSFFQMTQLILYPSDSLGTMLREGYVHRRAGAEMPIRFYAGMFRDVVERYQRVFGDRLLLCDFELMNNEPLTLLQAIEQHVGLRPFFNEENFENVRINRGDQPSSFVKLVNYLAMQQELIHLVEATLPRGALLRLKNYKERLAARSTKQQPKAEVSERDLEEARALFADDVTYVQQLFVDSPLRLGGGGS